MIKIDQLLKKLCPKGVQIKELWEITIWDKRFNGVENFKQSKVASFKHVPAAHLKTLIKQGGGVKLLSTGKFDGWTTEKDAASNLNIGEIISIPTGGSANIKYYNGKFVDSGNILAVAKDETIILKFVFYFLLANNEHIESLYRGAGVKHPNMQELLKLHVPIPPLEVQNEIVKILDMFTEFEAELNKELQVRKKQYEFYKNALLSLEGKKVEWKTLGELSTLITKGTTPKYFKDSGISFIKTEAFDGARINKIKISYVDEVTHKNYLKRSILEANDILITIAGATIGKAVIVTEDILPANTNQALAIIRLKKSVNYRYIFYLLRSKYMEHYIAQSIKGSAQPNLNLQQLNNFLVPLPSVSDQDQIVFILDKFDLLVNDVSFGLPAEINTRKKQYEHYRNQLLTFKKLNNE